MKLSLSAEVLNKKWIMRDVVALLMTLDYVIARLAIFLCALIQYDIRVGTVST